MVSPRLLLTNHHVLEDADVARRSAIEFDFEDGLDGQPRQTREFGLDPESFFLADDERDFALVAVEATDSQLATYGFNRLIEVEGKAIIGDFVTIVQHPGGRKKQVALRENRVVDVVDAFLHYETDTEPGSSGSPVFNDQWEVVALHHASVPAPEHGELGGHMNEGIRVSRILEFARRPRDLSATATALLAGLALAERIVLRQHAPDIAPPPGNGGGNGGSRVLQTMPAPTAPAAPGGVLHVTIPLEVTLAVGSPVVAGAPSASATEAITIDPDYAARRGYDAGFLGGAHQVPLPVLAAGLAAQAAIPDGATGPDAAVLRYHHFSVVMNRERRLAFYTAVNIDGAQTVRIKRERDRWRFDPRLPESAQTGEAVYEDNPLDRGHLVRRLDPSWAATRAGAKLANDDTFHFTNCTPQHERFNQNRSTWAGLEDYILDNADNRDFRASVFTGPVLADDDDEFEGVQLPRQFWKVAVMVRGDGTLSATAYLLSQEELIQGLETEGFDYGAYKTFQVPVSRIETLTGLDFGALRDADPLGRLEAAMVKEVEGPGDLVV